MKKTMKAKEFFEQAINLSGKSQSQIAQEVGYETPNIISMMKIGSSKIPFDRIEQLALATGVDPALFARVVMKDYEPEIYSLFVKEYDDPLTENETKILNAYREIDPMQQKELDEELFLEISKNVE